MKITEDFWDKNVSMIWGKEGLDWRYYFHKWDFGFYPISPLILYWWN